MAYATNTPERDSLSQTLFSLLQGNVNLYCNLQHKAAQDTYNLICCLKSGCCGLTCQAAKHPSPTHAICTPPPAVGWGENQEKLNLVGHDEDSLIGQKGKIITITIITIEEYIKK